jgi:hypothetical protein
MSRRTQLACPTLTAHIAANASGKEKVPLWGGTSSLDGGKNA